MFGKRIKKRSYWTSFLNATFVLGKRHTATFGSPIAANPRVMEFLNFVVTSSSPTFAGRDATSLDCSHIEGTPFARHASERRHGTLKAVPDKKLDGVPNALGWRLGRSNCATLLRESRAKRGNGARGMVGTICKACGTKRRRGVMAP